MTMPLPAGVILAGGRARRMGGGDKGRLRLGQQSLFEHVIARLSPQVAQIAINANGDAARLADLGLPVLPDTLADHPGPLAGVLAGMRWAAREGHDTLITVAADTPFFPKTLVADLATINSPSGLVLAATQEGPKTWPQPTFGLWPVVLADDLEAALRGGLRKILHWTDRHQAGYAVYEGGSMDPFFNINTPEDLAAAHARL